MNENLKDTKTITLRKDAKDIKITQYPKSQYQKDPETHISYISDSHPNKHCIEAIKGLWEEDTINNNIIILK